MFFDPRLTEVSGLAASRAHPGLYWTENDSGNGPHLTAIRADGSPVATVDIIGATNIDWEDLDSFDLGGKHYLMIADTGDNGGIRKTLTLYFVEEPQRLRDGDQLRLAWITSFRWPDGPRDCEATAVDTSAGQVLLISKKRVPPELFAVRLQPAGRLQTAQRLTSLPGIAQPSASDLEQNPVYGRYRSQISGADLSSNGRVLAVLNYHSVHLYVRGAGQSWAHAMRGEPRQLAFPWLPQAEAIAFSPDGLSLLIGSEQRPSPLLVFHSLP